MSDTTDRYPHHDALVELIRAVRATGYQFVTPTPSTHERVNRRLGNEWARNLRDVLGWSRRFQPDVVPPAILDLMQQAKVVSPCSDGWRSTIRVSSAQGQLYVHSAYPTQTSDAVFFGPDSYRYIDAVQDLLSRRPNVRRAYDIGCGAGPGALTVALARPTAEVWACDINPLAVQMTRANATAAGAMNVKCNVAGMLSGASGSFDLITANPPYLNDSLGRAYRHGGGRFGEELALNMLDEGIDRLSDGGSMLLYTGTAIVDGHDLLLTDVQKLLDRKNREIDWKYRETDPDVFGEELDEPPYRDVERIAIVRVEVTV